MGHPPESVGFYAGASLEAGAGYSGASLQGAVGAQIDGTVAHRDDVGLSVSTFMTGAAAGGPPDPSSVSHPAQNQPPIVVGASVGAGGGIFYSDAANASDLAGPFQTRTLSVLGIQVQYATGTNSSHQPISVLSLGYSFGFGVSYSNVTTMTVAHQYGQNVCP